MGHEKLIPQPPYGRRTGFAMLAEADPAIACVLWPFIRNVRDWVEVLPALQSGLFTDPPAWVMAKWREAQWVEPAIARELATLGTFRSKSRDLAAIAAAAETLARWADERDYSQTAIELAEAAANLDCNVARLANLAGRFTRKAREFPRAEIWFERGIGLARRTRDWVEYTRGHLGAGILAMGLGREKRAQRHFNTASVIAMREGQEWLAAEAQHDLFQFVTMRGSYDDAELHARRALKWYPKHHPRFPYFVADVAFLLVSQGYFYPAVELLRLFVSTIKHPRTCWGLALWCGHSRAQV